MIQLVDFKYHFVYSYFDQDIPHPYDSWKGMNKSNCLSEFVDVLLNHNVYFKFTYGKQTEMVKMLWCWCKIPTIVLK